MYDKGPHIIKQHWFMQKLSFQEQSYFDIYVAFLMLKPQLPSSYIDGPSWQLRVGICFVDTNYLMRPLKLHKPWTFLLLFEYWWCWWWRKSVFLIRFSLHQRVLLPHTWNAAVQNKVWDYALKFQFMEKISQQWPSAQPEFHKSINSSFRILT